MLPAPIVAAIISSVVGVGTTMYATQEQKKAQDEAEARMREAEIDAKRLADQIAADTRPEGEELTGIEFGSDDDDEESYDSFVVDAPTKPNIGVTGYGGLGFS